MIVRDIEEKDYWAIEKIYGKQNFDYKFPNLSSPLFISRKVCEDETGKVLGCVVVKLQGECYLFLPPDGKPAEKLEAINKLNESVATDCYSKGLDQITGWIPIEIEEKFSKRLTKLGFIKSKWNSWTKNLLE